MLLEHHQTHVKAGIQGIMVLSVYYSAVSVADIKVIHIWVNVLMIYSV